MVRQRQASRKQQGTSRAYLPKKAVGHGLRELVLIGFGFLGVYLFVTLVTYNPLDPGLSHSGQVTEVKNAGGVAGAYFADTLFYLFGYFAYLFPVMVAYLGWIIYQGQHHHILTEPRKWGIPIIGFAITLSAGCGLAIVHFATANVLLPSHAGGILGMAVGKTLESVFDQLGATLILLVLFFTGVTLSTGLSWLRVMDRLGYHTLHHLPILQTFLSEQIFPRVSAAFSKTYTTTKQVLYAVFLRTRETYDNLKLAWRERVAEWRHEHQDYEDDDYYDEYFDEEERPDDKPEKPARRGFFGRRTADADAEIDVDEFAQPVTQSHEEIETHPSSPSAKPFVLPPLKLLEDPPLPEQDFDEEELSRRVVRLCRRLNFDVEVKAVYPGPVLNGVEIKALSDLPFPYLEDFNEALARAMRVTKVQTVETQPGLLSLEIANPHRHSIMLRHLLQTPEYADNHSRLCVALGRDLRGMPIIVDLNRIPHILMAGSDPDDKQMALHATLLSLLYKSTPQELRLALIASPQTEFTPYIDMPHLLTPISSEIATTLAVLHWCVQEMERRYHTMTELGVRNIEGYNELVRNDEKLEFLEEVASNHQTIPYLVIVIEEIAELMHHAEAQKAEDLISEIAQKSRSAGIHLLLATQYPTVNVVTGLLKNQITTRIAFRVENRTESRTILGQMGAENLLGQGDMLYMTAGTGSAVRVHGCEVSTEEVQDVVQYLKLQASPDYIAL